MASLFNQQMIIDEYGKYYIKGGQNRQRLISTIAQAPETLERHGKHIKTEETLYRMANYTFGTLIQPFKTSFDPKSEITFYPNEIYLRKMKVDVELTPDEIEEGWLGFLGGDSSKNKKDWPVVRWLMEEYLAKKIGEDRELELVYKGVYNADGTEVVDCMDGIQQLLINGASATYPINVVDGIGALDKNTIFDQVEAFDEAFPAKMTNQKMVIFMSPSWVRAYKKDKRAQGFYFIDNPAELDESVMFSNHVVCGLPSMEGTSDLWATVPDNLIWLTKREGNLANADIQQINREVHIMVDWWEGIGFGCNQLVWATSETVGTATTDETTPE